MHSLSIRKSETHDYDSQNNQKSTTYHFRWLFHDQSHFHDFSMTVETLKTARCAADTVLYKGRYRVFVTTYLQPKSADLITDAGVRFEAVQHSNHCFVAFADADVERCTSLVLLRHKNMPHTSGFGSGCTGALDQIFWLTLGALQLCLLDSKSQISSAFSADLNIFLQETHMVRFEQWMSVLTV